jgi:hypothetical protein
MVALAALDTVRSFKREVATGGEAITGNRGTNGFRSVVTLHTAVEQLSHCRDDHNLAGLAGGPLPFFLARALD